jgi:hypothetical protein
MLIPELVAGIDPESALETSDQAAMMEDMTWWPPSEHRLFEKVELTMKMNETKVKVVTRPPNQIISPYAYDILERLAIAKENPHN